MADLHGDDSEGYSFVNNTLLYYVFHFFLGFAKIYHSITVSMGTLG